LNPFEDRKKQIEQIRMLVTLSGADSAPFDVPYPHYPPQSGLQNEHDIVGLLGRDHYRIVFYDTNMNEMQNWITDEFNRDSIVSAVMNIPYQTPWECEYIGVYLVREQEAQRMEWYSKHVITTFEWRKGIPPK